MRVVTRLVFVHYISRQLVLGHQLGVTVAPAAGRRDVGREHSGLWRFDFQNVVGAMAIGADSDFLVVVLKQLLTMLAGFVARELIGRQSVRIHPPHIAMTGRTQLGNRLFVIGPLEIICGVCGFVGGFRIATVAIHTRQASLRMHAGSPQMSLVWMAGQTARRISGGGRAGHDKPQCDGRRDYIAPPE